MATFFIKHITKYTYSSNVIDGATLTRLHPINDAYQKVISHTLSISKNPVIESFYDFFNNRVGTFMITEPHCKLNIISDIEVMTQNRLFPDDSVKTEEQWANLKSLKNHINFIDFLKYKPFAGSEAISMFVISNKLSSLSPFKAVLELCDYVYKHFKYIKGITDVSTPLDSIWELKAGVCQDFTNILLQMARMLGVPARYVSGYICPSDHMTRGEGATHAWVEVYIPFYGWLGIDPTNNTIANENHVRLAVGRYYNDCSPIKGVFKGHVESKMEVFVEVQKSKLDVTSSFPESFIQNLETNNSYKRNLEISQQYQQQQ